MENGFEATAGESHIVELLPFACADSNVFHLLLMNNDGEKRRNVVEDLARWNVILKYVISGLAVLASRSAYFQAILAHGPVLAGPLVYSSGVNPGLNLSFAFDFIHQYSDI